MGLPVIWRLSHRRPSPCRYCTDRSATCHIECSRYKLWYDELQELKKPMQKYKQFMQYYAERKKRFDKIRRQHRIK